MNIKEAPKTPLCQRRERLSEEVERGPCKKDGTKESGLLLQLCPQACEILREQKRASRNYIWGKKTDKKVSAWSGWGEMMNRPAVVLLLSLPSGRRISDTGKQNTDGE